MLRLGLVLIALAVFAAASLALGRRRHRRRGEPRLGVLPAGLTHLASQVGALSSFDMGLTLPPHGGRRRGGPLIGVR